MITKRVFWYLTSQFSAWFVQSKLAWITNISWTKNGFRAPFAVISLYLLMIGQIAEDQLVIRMANMGVVYCLAKMMIRTARCFGCIYGSLTNQIVTKNRSSREHELKPFSLKEKMISYMICCCCLKTIQDLGYCCVQCEFIIHQRCLDAIPKNTKAHFTHNTSLILVLLMFLRVEKIVMCVKIKSKALV